MLISTPGSSSDEDVKRQSLIRNYKDLEKRVLSVQDIRAIDKIDGSDDSENKELAHFNPSAKLNMTKCFEDIRENIEEELEFDITDSDVSIIVSIMLPFSVVRNGDSLTLVKTNSLLYSKLYDRD
mmetsp:Transcript_22509/g.25883  ORF Transcript_22509/g.25883 Transcript_22509/m.25883 type:complete len:125 (+) Transcript_22509:130-504(+)